MQQIAGGFYHSLVLVQANEAKSLSADVSILLNNPIYSDVTFSVEGRAIYAHRCILGARCEILEKMLDGPMRESASPTITLPDVSYAAFTALLEYLYTESARVFREVPVDRKCVLELLCVSDQYLVNDLKRQCETVLIGCIQLDTVCEMLELADAHRAGTLKKQCMEFIFGNFTAVVALDTFLGLPRPILKELFMELSRRGCFVGQRPAVGNNSSDTRVAK